jgi:hypothetical protein
MRFLLSLLALGSVSLLSPDARACGGCFHEIPTVGGGQQTGTVVTDHRIVLSLSSKETTLWDQVEYAGSPSGFAWVLPIRGVVRVGVGDDGFVDALDQLTTPAIHGPTVPCTRTVSSGANDPDDGSYSGGSASAGGCGGSTSTASPRPKAYTSGGSTTVETDDVSGGDESVTVTARSTVGPYEAVQVHGTDEGSIAGWLRAHDYEIPTDIEPILDAYVKDGFDFLAVRLKPGADVSAMRPIRVTFPGAYPTLPLRMVRAGAGKSVGMLVMVIGEGRWKTASFPSFIVDRSWIEWDFLVSRSSYSDDRAAAAAKLGGAAFALESSIDVAPDDIPVTPAQPSPMFDSGVSEASIDAMVDGEGDSASEAGDAASEAAATVDVDTTTDLDLAFPAGEARRVTRLRGDLPSASLDEDLTFEADTDPSELSREVNVKRYENFGAVCPASKPSPTPSTPSNMDALTQPRSSSGCACSLGGERVLPPVALGACAIAIAAIARRRRHGAGR